jgi:predicted dienelactone hydrolase
MSPLVRRSILASLFCALFVSSSLIVPAKAEAVRDLAVISLKINKTVRLTDRRKARMLRGAVRIQNRGTETVIIPDMDALTAGIQVTANRMEGPIHCAPMSMTPRLKGRQTFPLSIPSKKKLRVRFEMDCLCGSNPGEEDDWKFTARVNHSAIDGNTDENPSDDVCPRDPLGGVPNPDGRIRDRGCGTRVPDGTRTAPLVNVRDSRSSTPLLVAGPFDVGTLELPLVDDSRPTMPNGDFPGAPDRSLPTIVWYPAPAGEGGPSAPLAPEGAPYPLVIFSHGLGSVRDQSTFLTTHLASHGYVVAAPTYPLSNMAAPGGQTMADQPAQAGDVGFLLDTFVGLSMEAGHLLEGGIDADRIGLTGHSNGGGTTLIATYDQQLRDPRIKAAVPMSGPGCFYQPGYYTDVDVPLLVLHGDADLFVDFAGHAQAIFDRANPQKSLVRVLAGNHMGFSDMGTVLSDVIGCLFLPDPETLAQQTQDLIAGLGGAANFVSDDGCPLGFCVGEGTAMDGKRQQQIGRQLVLAFFESVLRGDPVADEYLYDDLETLNPDLTHQFVR